MNAKKVCCLFTVTAMPFFGLPAVPFANVERTPPLSQEELGLVFQNAKSTWKEKQDFLKYLDEQEMKETKGKAAQIVVGGLIGAGGGAVVGGVSAYVAGGDVAYGAATGAVAGALTGMGVGILRELGRGLETQVLAGISLSNTLGFGTASGCYYCHGFRPQGGH